MEVNSKAKKSAFRKWWPSVALAIWAPSLIVICAFLLAGHWITLPLPSGGDPKLAQSIHEHRSIDEMGEWLAVHVLYSRCNCSKRIVNHLLSRERIPGVKEKIILVEHQPEWESHAKKMGIPVEVLTRHELESVYNIPAAPIMVVADPGGSIRYAGGYTTRKQGPDIRDIAVINAAMQEHPAEPIPLFGCAVAKTLSTLLDPIGVKQFSASL